MFHSWLCVGLLDETLHLNTIDSRLSIPIALEVDALTVGREDRAYRERVARPVLARRSPAAARGEEDGGRRGVGVAVAAEEKGSFGVGAEAGELVGVRFLFFCFLVGCVWGDGYRVGDV